MANQTTKPKTFLVNPNNADFVRGKAAAPADGGTRAALLGYFIFTLLMVVALLLGGVTFVQWRNYNALSTSGVTTDASVIDQRVSQDSDNADTYYLTYRFEVGGNGYQRELSVGRELYRATVIGDTLPVIYLPGDPTVSRLVADLRPPRNLLLITSVFALAPVLSLIVAMFNQSKQNRYKRHGRLVRGDLEQVIEDGDSDDDWYDLGYVFQEPGTRNILQGKHRVYKRLNLRQIPRRGMSVAVYYADRDTFRLL